MHFASYYRWLVYQHVFGPPANISTLLDIGSDDAGFVEKLKPRTAVAVDIDRQRLIAARAAHPVCADGTQMPFANTAFDVVVLSDVIEHVVNDDALVRNAVSCVRPGGTFWLSTTAADFQLFPNAMTARAERSWGHVRKGYTRERLAQVIGAECTCEIVVWPEIMLRHLYLVLWVLSKLLPGAARAGARGCFLLDMRLRGWQADRGHMYVQAIRRSASYQP